MVTIEYCPEGKAISDFELGEFSAWIMTSIALQEQGHTFVQDTCKVSSEIAISHLRMLIAQGEIDHDKVVFVFEGQELRANRFGAITQTWPRGFCDTGVIIAEKTIVAAMERRKKEKEA